MSRADSIKILYQELKTGILSLTDIQEQVDMNKKQVLDLHKKMYNYWQGKNGKWYSYLPKEGVDKPKGKQIESISQEKLDNRIVEYYVNAEKEKKDQENSCPTFLEVYYMWRKVKDLELDDNSIYKYKNNNNWQNNCNVKFHPMWNFHSLTNICFFLIIFKSPTIF